VPITGVKYVVAAALAGAVASAAAQLPSPASRGELLDRAGAKVESYLATLPTLVATETMLQRVSVPTGRTADADRRVWIAEVAWVSLPDEGEAIAVRDVLEVNGQPVTGDRSRLVDLLHGVRRGTWDEARALLDEGARHNLVPGSRNFNLPTVALFFLHPDRRPRFSWKGQVPRRTAPPSSAPIEIAFREKSRPTVIRGERGEQIYSRGHVWLSPDGTVVRTELRLEIERVKYTLEARFGMDPGLALVVPVTLHEIYAAPDGVVTSAATYSNYRRYQTGARLVP
jgi:hypothetical protein